MKVVKDYISRRFDKLDQLIGIVEVSEESGVEAITDNTLQSDEYFTLQGVKVETPQQGGIYIRRQGTAVSKVVIK